MVSLASRFVGPQRKGLAIGRRDLAGAAAAGMLVASLPGSAFANTRPPSGIIPFTVFRGGSEMGHHHTRFSVEDDALRVDIQIRLTATFAGITVFRYTHDSVERWQDGRLVSIDTETYDDGREYRVRGHADGDVFRILEGRDGPWEAPADIIPTSYWHIGCVRNERLLHTQYGEPFVVSTQRLGRESITAAGRTIAADRYRLTASLVVDVWYNPADQWAKLAFEARGAQVDYVLDAGDGSASTLATRSG